MSSIINIYINFVNHWVLDGQPDFIKSTVFNVKNLALEFKLLFINNFNHTAKNFLKLNTVLSTRSDAQKHVFDIFNKTIYKPIFHV